MKPFYFLIRPGGVSIIQKSAHYEEFATIGLVVHGQRTGEAHFPTFLFRWEVEMILFPSNFEKACMNGRGWSCF